MKNVYYMRNLNTKQLFTINISKFISAKSYEKATEDVDYKNICFDPGAHAHNWSLEYALEYLVIVLYVYPGETLNFQFLRNPLSLNQAKITRYIYLLS